MLVLLQKGQISPQCRVDYETQLNTVIENFVNLNIRGNWTSHTWRVLTPETEI